MNMVVSTIVYTVILVFGITGIGFLLGKLNKLGDDDSIIDAEEVE